MDVDPQTLEIAAARRAVDLLGLIYSGSKVKFSNIDVRFVPLISRSHGTDAACELPFCPFLSTGYGDSVATLVPSCPRLVPSFVGTNNSL